ncbi:MAG TPA: hypothetical protein VGP07_25790 [Polyangia bacterium]|jgi:hypothetical protein
MTARRRVPVSLSLFFLLFAGRAKAQAPGVAAAVPAAPAVTPLPPGTHLGAAVVPIVGGNLASARERALAEALKQAVGEAIGLVAPDARATQAKTVVQVLGKARSFVQRYRTREDGEGGPGLYSVKIEADVDEAALRQTFERAPAAGTAPAASAPSCLLVASGPLEASDALAHALIAAHVRVERAREGLQPAQALDAAARAGVGAVVLVNATATNEGPVRGVGVESVSCALAARMVAAGTGVALAEDSRTDRSFALREEDARKDCFARVAALVARQLMPQTGGARASSELRIIVADVDVVEPGAVLGLLKQLRASGSVSSVDVRRILPGRLELAIRSRLTGNGLAAALAREGGGPVTLSAMEVSGDLVRMTARAREPVAPPPPVTPAPAAPSAQPGKPTSP